MSNEDAVNNNQKKFRSVLEYRKYVLSDIMKGPETEQQTRAQVAFFKFFDDDLNDCRKKKAENAETEAVAASLESAISKVEAGEENVQVENTEEISDVTTKEIEDRITDDVTGTWECVGTKREEGTLANPVVEGQSIAISADCSSKSYKTLTAEEATPSQSTLEDSVGAPVAESVAEKGEQLEGAEANGVVQRYGRNVYETVLTLLTHMPEKRKTNGTLLTTWLLRSFQIWLEKNDQRKEIQDEYLTEDVMKIAMLRGSLDMEHSKSICSVFHLTPEAMEEAVRQMMRSLLESGRYKDAAEYAIVNNLVDEYNHEQLILPLILTDKNQVVYEVLNASVRMQKEHVKFLDGFVKMWPSQTEAFFEPYKQKGMVSIDTQKRFLYKNLTSHIRKFFSNTVKQFGYDLVEARDAPNFDLDAKQKCLRHYIHCRFTHDGTKPCLKDDPYFERVFNHVQICQPEITKHLLEVLWNESDRTRKIDALCWVTHLNPPKSLMPQSLVEFFEFPDQEMILEAKTIVERRNNQTFQEPGEQLYVTSVNEEFPIRIIRTAQEMDDLCVKLTELDETASDDVYVGFDTEWKPPNPDHKNMTVTSTKIAMIQLFFDNQVWLVDTVELEKPETETTTDKWQKFTDCLLGSHNFKVIGFDLKNDMDAFLTIPGIVLKVEKIQNAVCLKTFTERVCKKTHDILELDDKKTFKLSFLCEKLLGQNLDKSEQCSNWQARPLRKNQLIYAAMDAVVVVQIFKKALELTKTKSVVNIERLLLRSTVGAIAQDEARRKWLKSDKLSWETVRTAIINHCDKSKPLTKPRDIKILVDTSLRALGKNLARLGMDVNFARTSDCFQKAMKTVKESNEHRYVVTSPLGNYSTMLPEYKHLIITIEDVSSQSKLGHLNCVFKYFNIDISEMVDESVQHFDSEAEGDVEDVAV